VSIGAQDSNLVASPLAGAARRRQQPLDLTTHIARPDSRLWRVPASARQTNHTTGHALNRDPARCRKLRNDQGSHESIPCRGQGFRQQNTDSVCTPAGNLLLAAWLVAEGGDIVLGRFPRACPSTCWLTSSCARRATTSPTRRRTSETWAIGRQAQADLLTAPAGASDDELRTKF